MPAHSAQLDTSAHVTLLYGSSDILKERAARRMIDARLAPEARAEGLSVLVAGELGPERLSTELSSRSLLATDRVVIVKRVDDLKADDQRQFAAALAHLPDSTTVILTCAETEKGRKAAVVADFTRAVQQIGQTVRIASPQKESLAAWIGQEAENHGKTIAGPAIELLRELTDDNVDLLVSEVAKAATYVGDRPQIGESDVQAVGFGSQRGNIWDMVDAIGTRSAAQALRELASMLPPGTVHSEAQPLLGQISRQLRLIWQARVAAREGYRLDRTTEVPEELVTKFPTQHNVVSLVRGRGWMGRKLTNQARKFTDVQLVRALARVHETDLALKGQGGEQLDERPALETLIVELCQL